MQPSATLQSARGLVLLRQPPLVPHLLGSHRFLHPSSVLITRIETGSRICNCSNKFWEEFNAGSFPSNVLVCATYELP
jgi:hypothetical protein